MGTRARVGEEERILPLQRVAKSECECVVFVLAAVLKCEDAARRKAVRRDRQVFVDVIEAVGAALFEKLGGEINRAGKLTLESHAPVQRARLSEGCGIGLERGDHGWAERCDAVRGVEKILAAARERAREFVEIAAVV